MSCMSLTRFIQDESSRRVRPRKLETGSQRGNPDLPNRRVWADHESGFIRVFEEHFELSASPLNFESALIAHFLKAAAQRFKGGITPSLKFLFIHGRDRVPRSRGAGKEVSREKGGKGKCKI